MRFFKGVILFFFLTLAFNSVNAQSIFDNAESWLKKHHTTIAYGPQYSWYKYSNIRIVQPYVQRDAELMYVQGRQTDNTEALKRGELSTAQSKISVNMELSTKYDIQVYTTHLNYEIINSKDYHLRGVWNGEQIAETIPTSQYFNQLEHTNGLNFWGIGVKRKINLIKRDNLTMDIGLMPNIGGVFTATQAQIYNPNGDLAYYDPGNGFSGVVLAGESSLNTVFKSHWVVSGNFNFFQTYIKEAKLDHHAFVITKA